MREIFCDKNVLQEINQSKGEAKLKEELTGQSIIIGGIPKNAILLKLDVDKRGYKQRSAYLRNGVEYIHKGCDYCLILLETNQAVLFELKSNRPKEYADQFVASELFVDYCTKLWNKYNCADITLSFKRVLLSPRFNRTLTSSKELLRFTKRDRCKTDISIISPGFPSRVRLEKLLK